MTASKRKAKREFEEETGMELDPPRLDVLFADTPSWSMDKRRRIYTYELPSRPKPSTDASWYREDGAWIMDEPRELDEIGRMALIPADEKFKTGGHSVVSPIYKWGDVRNIKLYLNIDFV